MDTIWKHLTFKAVPLLANIPVLIGLVVAILAEPVAHAARHDALLSVAALDVSLAALPTPAVQLVHAAGAVGSPVADPPESAKDDFWIRTPSIIDPIFHALQLPTSPQCT